MQLFSGIWRQGLSTQVSFASFEGLELFVRCVSVAVTTYEDCR